MLIRFGSNRVWLKLNFHCTERLRQKHVTDYLFTDTLERTGTEDTLCDASTDSKISSK